jgi:hypothetical protein
VGPKTPPPPGGGGRWWQLSGPSRDARRPKGTHMTTGGAHTVHGAGCSGESAQNGVPLAGAPSAPLHDAQHSCDVPTTFSASARRTVASVGAAPALLCHRFPSASAAADAAATCSMITAPGASSNVALGIPRQTDGLSEGQHVSEENSHGRIDGHPMTDIRVARRSPSVRGEQPRADSWADGWRVTMDSDDCFMHTHRLDTCVIIIARGIRCIPNPRSMWVWAESEGQQSLRDHTQTLTSRQQHCHVAASSSPKVPR